MKRYLCWASHCGFDVPPDPKDPNNQPPTDPDNHTQISATFEAADHASAATIAAHAWEWFWVDSIHSRSPSWEELQGDHEIGIAVRDDDGLTMFFRITLTQTLHQQFEIDEVY